MSELYDQRILELARSKRAVGRLEHADATATADNPLCGDRVTIDLAGDTAAIRELAQKTRGCLLTRAAAAVVADSAGSLSPSDLAALALAVRRFLEGGGEPPLPALEAFRPVREVKSRHDCVAIAFDALARAGELLPPSEAAGR